MFNRYFLPIIAAGAFLLVGLASGHGQDSDKGLRLAGKIPESLVNATVHLMNGLTHYRELKTQEVLGTTISIPDRCDWQNEAEKIIKNNDFSKKRSMDKYENVFGDSFKDHLKSLKEHHHVMDAGAGEGLALQDLHEKGMGHGPRLTAITYIMENEHSREFFKRTPDTQVLTGEYFENIPREKLTENFGPVHLLVDLFGVMSYTSFPTRVLNTYLDILASDGAIFLYMGLGFQNMVKGPNGKEMTFLGWLRRQTQLEVTPAGGGVLIRKVVPKINPLPDMKTVFIKEDGQPPYNRIYEVFPLKKKNKKRPPYSLQVTFSLKK